MSAGKLLIIDDDPMIGQTICAIAKTASVEARFTSSPGEFFRELETWGPTHIALDLVMPHMDGVQIIAELAKRECKAKLIITSGQGSRVLDAAGRSAAWHGLTILAILSKPFSSTQLRKLLAEDGSPTSVSGETVKRSQNNHIDITEKEIKEAIDRQEFSLVYQPKIFCASGQLSGFEALVRWNNPIRGMVRPDHFIPVAEKSGLIDPLTSLIFESAVGWLSAFDSHVEFSGKSFPKKPKLAVNISPNSLSNAELIESLEFRCQENEIVPERLILEITETSAMEHNVVSLDLLTRLRLKGFHLSIDDFGTGYSSMLQLVRMPFSEIKIDKSFVSNASQSQEFRTVIKSIVTLGHSLGLMCTAEGLEDEVTLKYLNEVGCDLVQGYHIARPMDGEAALRWALERV